jgi:hypothetical protein
MLLSIEVSMGDSKGSQKLELFENDDPVQVVRKFADENGLSEKKAKKLEEMLVAKMEEH